MKDEQADSFSDDVVVEKTVKFFDEELDKSCERIAEILLSKLEFKIKNEKFLDLKTIQD